MSSVGSPLHDNALTNNSSWHCGRMGKEGFITLTRAYFIAYSQTPDEYCFSGRSFNCRSERFTWNPTKYICIVTANQNHVETYNQGDHICLLYHKGYWYDSRCTSCYKSDHSHYKSEWSLTIIPFSGQLLHPIYRCHLWCNQNWYWTPALINVSR